MKIITKYFCRGYDPSFKKKKIQQIGSRVSSRNTRIHLKNMMNASSKINHSILLSYKRVIWKTALRESPNESYRQAAHWVWRKREYAGKLRKFFSKKKMFSFNTSVVPLWPQGDSNNQFIYYISGGYIVIYFLIFFISYVSRRREVT